MKSQLKVNNKIQESTENSAHSSQIITATRRSIVNKISSQIPKEIKIKYDQSKALFPNKLSEFVYLRTYSRWLDDKKRRETWVETVDRYMSFMRENLSKKLTESEYEKIRDYILSFKTMPSMRLLQFSGEAARRCNVCAYNCSFIAPTTLDAFGDVMYILMSGTGVGYTVEAEVVAKLPRIQKQSGQKVDTFVVQDSREGWAEALVYGLKCWYGGKDVDFDYSLVRPFGSILKVTGGRASGPEPLMEVMDFARKLILSKQGIRLSTLDVHDLMCKIGMVVIAGGVRRSALISLSDLNDSAIANSKNGQFWDLHPQRSMANNSAVYNVKPSTSDFLEEFLTLIHSNSGERGIFSRSGLRSTLPKRRRKLLKNDIETLGTNPCGEIILQSHQFCNLSEVVARVDDTVETLLEKVRIATIIGTYQATLTKFNYISKRWRKNSESERLLGVSITGQYDCPVVRDPEVLSLLRKESIKVNKEYSKRFGINPSTAITAVKPSGNASQVVDASSGMHPRFSEYYIRRVRIASHDPLFELLRDQGVPYFPEVGQTMENATTFVVEFPVKSPEGAICNKDVNAIQQLEYWKKVKENYTEHNPSITVYVESHEWIQVANWVYNHWDIVGGISFLPKSDHVYQLAPYEAIDKEKYEEMVKNFPDLDFSLLYVYENEDMTEQKHELACMGGACEI